MRPSTRLVLRTLSTAVLATLALLLPVAAASAHTEFEGSAPEDGATVPAPLDSVTLSFTNPAIPSGDGIVLLEGSGAEVEATLDEDGTDFTLRPSTPLQEGTYGVRWEVRAGDAHPIDGTFTFSVVPSAQTSPPPGSSTTEATPPPSLSDALEDGTGGAAPIRAVSRLLVISGAMVAIGGLLVLLTTVRGSPRELRRVLGWVRAAGLVVAVGGVLRLAVLSTSMPSVAEAWTSPLGVASSLRVLGGLAVVVGLPVSGLGVGEHEEVGQDASTRPRPRGLGPALGLLGALMVLVAFWFDGHTVTKGAWPVHAAVNAAHVAAGAIWSGGVLVLWALVLWRHRRGVPLDGAWLVGRFSRIAGAVLAVVVLAGVGLAVVVLDSVEQLWTTSWGVLLVAKTAAVGVAAVLGALMHLRLRPALLREPDDPAAAVRVRRSLAAEAVAFVGVIALTAWLVAATT